MLGFNNDVSLTMTKRLPLTVGGGRTWLTGNTRPCVVQHTAHVKFEGIVKGMESAGIVEPTAVAFNLDLAAFLMGN